MSTKVGFPKVPKPMSGNVIRQANSYFQTIRIWWPENIDKEKRIYILTYVGEYSFI